MKNAKSIASSFRSLAVGGLLAVTGATTGCTTISRVNNGDGTTTQRLCHEHDVVIDKKGNRHGGEEEGRHCHERTYETPRQTVIIVEEYYPQRPRRCHSHGWNGYHCH